MTITEKIRRQVKSGGAAAEKLALSGEKIIYS
jgi:hypothetical protein